MRLLVIEDNVTIASLLRQELTNGGHTVESCATGLEGERIAGSGAYDAIVLDVGLPDCSGVQVCHNLRQSGVTTPVLMLTVLSSSSDKVLGLSAGADDYLTKPFDFDELKARLTALHRRANASTSSLLKYADVELNTATRSAQRAGRKIDLTKREFELLLLFMRDPHRVISRETIGTAVWGHSFDSDSNVIDVYICMLRRKLNHDHSHPLIRTVVGTGYALDVAGNDREKRKN